MLSKMVSLQFVLCLLLCGSCFVSAQKTIENDEIPDGLMECNRENKSEPITSYLNWPFSISCTELYTTFHFRFENTTELEGSDTSCVIRELPSGNIVHNASDFYHPFYNDFLEDSYQFEVTEDSPVDYIAQFKVAEHCYYQIIQTVKEHVEEQNCENEPLQTNGEFRATFGDPIVPKCYVPEELEGGDYTYRWMHDCNETLPSNAVTFKDGFVLRIEDASFENAGKYLCIVQYKGQELNAIEHNVCITYDSTSDEEITISCPKKQLARINHDATIQCTIDLGIGKAKEYLTLSKWLRTENASDVLCKNDDTGTTTEKSETVSCSMVSSLEKEPCYGKNPPDVLPHDVYTVNFTIRNIKRSQLEDITLEFQYSGEKFFKNITLVEDRSRVAAVSAGLLAGVIVLTALLLIAAVVGAWQQHHVKWYWKKHHGAYETDNCTYISYLAYYYNREMADKSKIELLVTNMHDFIEKLGGRLYDDAKQVSLSQYDAQNILQVQKDCHRIIIMLSPEFITDQWSLKTTYMALTEVVEAGKKVIFIEMPGARKQIKLLETEPKKTLQYAMKHNTTIPWDGKEKFTLEFRHRLEYALPKLESRKYGRYLSGSSQTYLTEKENGIATTFDETYSNDFQSV